MTAPCPRYCTAPHCPNRVSAASAVSVCDECARYPLAAVTAGPSLQRPSPKRYRPALNLPCACCGQAPRHLNGSYCAQCSGVYQAERQQRRAVGK